MKNIINLTVCKALVLGLAVCAFWACEKQLSGKHTSAEKVFLLDELLEESGCTDFLAIVEKSEMRGIMHAYGAYTLFAPTNAAVQAWLQQKGMNSIAELDLAQAADIVRYHFISDTIKTDDFVDGRLVSPNVAGKYLTSKQEGEVIQINRQGYIVGKNIRGENGLLHIVNTLLEEPQETITDRIRSLPDAQYSIMKEIFERSGLADMLSVKETGKWFSFFVQDNDAFIEAGIHNVEELLKELETFTPAVQNEDTLLYNYIGYHTIPGLKYVADLLVVSSLETFIKNQVITFKRNQDVILLNELVLGQTTEAGIPLDRQSEFSDWSCANGVIQKINGNIQIKIRSAYRIYWDIAEQPELMALSNFRKPGCNVNFKPGELSEIKWGGKAPQEINYWCSAIPKTYNAFDEKSQYVYADALRFNINANTTSWVEMKTPVLIGSPEGVAYKLWICYRRELELDLKTIFKQEGYEDQPLPFIFKMDEYMPDPSKSSHEQLEIDGWKMYNAKKFNSVVNSHLVGTIKVYTTGRHTLRFENGTSRGRGGQAGSWDMIHFIPIDENQIWPRVDIKGNWVYENVKQCEVFPENECPPDTTVTE